MITLKTIPAAVLVVMLACGNSTEMRPPESKTGASAPALTEYAATLPLDKIKLPAGFKIEVYAEVEDAR